MTPELQIPAIALAKITVLLALVLGVVLLARRLEPRWRVLLIRGGILAIPVLIALTLFQPLVELPRLSEARATETPAIIDPSAAFVSADDIAPAVSNEVAAMSASKADLLALVPTQTLTPSSAPFCWRLLPSDNRS
ncbi:MAG: hypothetical protein AAF585_20205 [Verrucomicrobiota bacterium]